MSLTHVPVELRRLVRARADGCCEYCRLAEAVSFTLHEIDHVIPKKHGGQTTAENLALSCALCNRRKGTDLASVDPETGQIVLLFHPRNDRWTDHFGLDGTRIAGLTSTGRATARLLGFNSEARLTERAAIQAAGSQPLM